VLRAALSLSVALAVAGGGGTAFAARTTTTVTGNVGAVAFSGDGLTIAHLPPRRGMTVERFVAGSPPQPLLGTSLRGETDQIQLAGSGQALAVGLQRDSEANFAESRVFAGPATGPLREVASCQASLLAPPVAVNGARIAWRDGACGDPPADPTAIEPAAIVIGAADPAAAATRLALEPGLLPASLALPATGALVGTLRPSFFAVDSQVLGFGLSGSGATLITERGAIVSPIGVLPDGSRVFSRAKLVASDDEARGGGVCASSLFTIGAGASQRELPTGGCLIGADAPASASAPRVAGDRVYALISSDAGRADDNLPRISVVSMRADGGDRRIHASGSYRPPQGLAADGDRVAYWQRRCSDANGDVVVVEGASQDRDAAGIASCRAQILTRSARLRDGRISISLRCPAGCRGVAVDQSGEIPQPLRSFALRAGTHALRLATSSAARRRGRLRLELSIESGPPRLGEIRLRR
jgi:hypothetical protein